MSTLAKRVSPKDEEVRDERIAALRQRVSSARKEIVRLSGTAKYSQVRYLSSVIAESLAELKAYGMSDT